VFHECQVHGAGGHGHHRDDKYFSDQRMPRGTFAESHGGGAGQDPDDASGDMNRKQGEKSMGATSLD